MSILEYYLFYLSMYFQKREVCFDFEYRIFVVSNAVLKLLWYATFKEYFPEEMVFLWIFAEKLELHFCYQLFTPIAP